MRSQARYVLQVPLSYSTRDGDQRPAEFLELNAPSGRHRRLLAPIRQATMKAVSEYEERVRLIAASAPPAKVVDAAEPTTEPEDEDDDGKAADGFMMLNVLAASSVDLEKLYQACADLFVLKGIVKVDGEVQMTTTLLDNLTARDFETLVGTYIANFTLA